MRRLCQAAVAVALLTGLVLMGTAAGAASTRSGNSVSAHTCQRGGWQHVLRASDRTGFARTGDCVSAAAQGATLAPRPIITSVTSELGHLAMYTRVTMTGADFAPNGTYPLRFHSVDGLQQDFTFRDPVVADAG